MWSACVPLAWTFHRFIPLPKTRLVSQRGANKRPELDNRSLARLLAYRIPSYTYYLAAKVAIRSRQPLFRLDLPLD